MRINATFARSFRALDVTITSVAPGPMAVSVPQGTVFEGLTYFPSAMIRGNGWPCSKSRAIVPFMFDYVR